MPPGTAAQGVRAPKVPGAKDPVPAAGVHGQGWPGQAPAAWGSQTAAAGSQGPRHLPSARSSGSQSAKAPTAAEGPLRGEQPQPPNSAPAHGLQRLRNIYSRLYVSVSVGGPPGACGSNKNVRLNGACA